MTTLKHETAHTFLVYFPFKSILNMTDREKFIKEREINKTLYIFHEIDIYQTSKSNNVFDKICKILFINI